MLISAALSVWYFRLQYCGTSSCLCKQIWIFHFYLYIVLASLFVDTSRSPDIMNSSTTVNRSKTAHFHYMVYDEVPRKRNAKLDFTFYIDRLKTRGKFIHHGQKLMTNTLQYSTKLKLVPVSEFIKALRNFDNFYDIMRLFFVDGDRMPDNVIEAELSRNRFSLINMTLTASKNDNLQIDGFWYDVPGVLLEEDCEQCAVVAEGSIRHKRHNTGRNNDVTSMPRPLEEDIPHSTTIKRRHPAAHERRHSRESNEQPREYFSLTRSKNISKSNELDEAATQHLQEMMELKCEQPVAEIVSVSRESNRTDVEYRPNCTVVHRCRRQYGCCQNDYSCAAKTTQTITRVFFAIRLDPNKNTEVVEKLPLEFENHTSCECKPQDTKNLASTDGRNLKCPKPFVRDDTFGCSCRCAADNRKCIKLSRGRRLSTKQIGCINRKECACIKPSCQRGVFNQARSRCPRSGISHKKRRF